MFFGGDTGADAGAAIYSVTETATLNGLRPYRYVEYLLTELPKIRDAEENMDETKLDLLIPWSPELPDECRSHSR